MLDNNLITLLIMPKPFIAARIPEALNNALEKHTNKKGGESRTDTVINALNTYLGQPLGAIEASPEVDRIAELEKRITTLEKRTSGKSATEGSVQGSLLDNNNVIGIESSDTKTTREICDLLSWSQAKIRSRRKRKQLPIKEKGYIIDCAGKQKQPPHGILWSVKRSDNKSD